ncbi:MAG: MmgE/PrpD family protein [Nocardioidaceae bacterium]
MDEAQPTARLARFVQATEPGVLPAGVAAHTRTLILDAVGCALAGWAAEELPQIDQAERALAGSGDSTIIGADRTSSMLGAVFQNAYLTTGITACDVYTPAHFHVTPEVVPVALAIAEQRHLTGRELIAGVAAGGEVATRLAGSLDYAEFRRRGWHAPGIIGPIGAAATAAKLMGLDAVGTRRAMSLAVSQAGGTFASWPTAAVKFHQCRGAVSGLLAGLLAEQGFEASSEPLMAEDGGLWASYAPGDVAALTAGLGERWELQNISLRMWPGATPVQALLTALLTDPTTQGIGAQEVRSMDIAVAPATYSSHRELARPHGAFEALLSFHFAAASALRDGRFGVDSIRPSAYEDPDLLRFIDERIRLTPDERVPRGGVHLRLSLADGRTLSVRQDHALGTPHEPMTASQAEAKFRAFAGTRLPPDRTEKLLVLMRDLDTVRDCADLLALTRSAAKSKER